MKRATANRWLHRFGFPGTFVVISVTSIASAGFLGASGDRVALVVGNEAYQHTRPLETAVADAKAVSERLSKHSGFDTVLGLDLSRDGFYEAMADFMIKARGAEAVIVFFAGHGVESATFGGNFLIPVDAALEKEVHLESQAISLDAVLEKLSRLPADVRLVILDCCRDNPLEGRSWANGRGGSGLAPVDLQRLAGSTMVVFSASPGKVALDSIDGDERHSPFASAVLREIDREGANAFSAFALVEDSVFQATGQRQRPKVFLSGSLGPFHAFQFKGSGRVGGTVEKREPVADSKREPAAAMKSAPAPRPMASAPDLSGSWLIRETVVPEKGGWRIDWIYDASRIGDLWSARGRKVGVNGNEPTRGEKLAVSDIAVRPRAGLSFQGNAVEVNHRGEELPFEVFLEFGEEGRSLAGQLWEDGKKVSDLVGTKAGATGPVP